MGGGGEQKIASGGLIPGIGIKPLEPFILLRLAIFPSFPYLVIPLPYLVRCVQRAGGLQGI